MKPTCTLLLVALSLAGCEEKKPNLAPVASSLAPPAVPSGPTVKKFAIEKNGKATLELEAPREKIKASTTASSGSIDVDLANLKASRGEIRVDLTTLTTATFPEAEKNASQTAHARTWLEVADAEAKLDDKLKEENRYAVYAIRSIEQASETDVRKIAPVREGAGEVRKATIIVKGELLVHGHKVEREAEIEVGFLYEPGVSADRPTGLTIVTKKPFRVTLAEHAVQPRDGLGKIAKGSFSLLGTKVAENADVTLDLRATPRS